MKGGKRLSSDHALRKRRRQPLLLPAEARRMPVFMSASSGSGKSRFLGRLLALQDFLDGYPLVILDPHGVMIDNLLDKLSRLPVTIPEEIRRQLWQRIRYVDMSGKLGYVVPFPLYYRLGNESLYTIA
jgi:DNA helicase HerA-like ATPase